MLDETAWVALGVAATLLGGYIAHRVGWVQISLMQQSHALDVKKATPRIGSRVEISPPEIVKDIFLRYTVYTTLYNDGDLAAYKVQGKWNLIASHAVEKAEKTICIDSLPTFLPWKMDYELTGKVNLLQADPTVALEVHVDLTYFGSDDKQEQYKTVYKYDHEQKRMVQQS